MVSSRAAAAAVVSVAAGLLAGCANQAGTAAAAAPVASPAAPAPAGPAWLGQARQVATSVPPKLLSVLRAEIDKGGPAGAIEVCKEQAPQLARQASEQSGWNVRRVSLKNRNPRAVPDAWERAALEDFDRRAAAGAPAGSLERAEVVNNAEGKPEWRYMRALPVIDLCTQCHGTPEQLGPAVQARLKALYPDDRGVGYRIGDIRGAMTLRKPAS